MDSRLTALLRLLDLERLEDTIFRGASRDIGSPQVYGGQVLGQALRAAYATVESGRVVHSLHAYFLRRGDFNSPIVYFVDRSRDGHSFSSRRVTAIQHGAQIFHMAASFQVEEAGLDHQLPCPDVPPPESVPEFALSPGEVARLPQKMQQFFLRDRPFETRMVASGEEGSATAHQYLWIRAVDRLPDDAALHRCLLAYASDFHLLRTALVPHAAALHAGNVLMASIDHAMWFHHPLRVDEWLLYATDSPAASGARGFARGSLYTRGGRLVASVAQEGLMRPLPAPPDG